MELDRYLEHRRQLWEVASNFDFVEGDEGRYSKRLVKDLRMPT
jgi:hypothetical protein